MGACDNTYRHLPNPPTNLYRLPQNRANKKGQWFFQATGIVQEEKVLANTTFSFSPENGTGREAVFLDSCVLLKFLRLNQGGIGTLTPGARREDASSSTNVLDGVAECVIS